MNLLFDTSALVKLVVDEPGTDESLALWDAANAPVAARLAHPELAGALGAAVRAGRIRRAQMPAIEDRTHAILDQLTWVELSRDIAHAAASLARQHALTGADAVHLASAAVQGPSSVLATFDHRMRQAAAAVGLGIAPAQIS